MKATISITLPEIKVENVEIATHTDKKKDNFYVIIGCLPNDAIHSSEQLIICMAQRSPG